LRVRSIIERPTPKVIPVDNNSPELAPSSSIKLTNVATSIAAALKSNNNPSMCKMVL
jgi:hypothetical protein